MSLSAFLLNQKRCARKQDLLDEAQQKGIKNVSKQSNKYACASLYCRSIKSTFRCNTLKSHHRHVSYT